MSIKARWVASRVGRGVSFDNGLTLRVCRFSNHASFQEILNELNDYAGQREVVAENMATGICTELAKYLQDLKQERKGVSEWGRGEREVGEELERPESSPFSSPQHLSDAKKAQQNLESSFKQLESVSHMFKTREMLLHFVNAAFIQAFVSADEEALCQGVGRS